MLTAFRDNDRCQPSLLDRLRDDRPRERTESRSASSYSWADYRDSVVRDLQWLMNTTSLAETGDLSAWTEVSRSTLNFGVPEVCAASAVAVQQRQWESAFQRAIARFEPRLREDSIRVRILPSESVPTPNMVIVEISAELIVAPIPIRFRVSMDRETSTVRIEEMLTGGAA